MCGSKSKPKVLPQLPEAPTAPDGQPVSAGDTDKRRRRASQGKSGNSTILTSTRGTTTAANAPTKVLLGA